MKDRLRPIWDYSFHKVALIAAALLGLLYLAAGPATPPPVNHPAGCHACSQCPPAAAAARDAYLLRAGAMEMEDLPAP